MLGAGLHFYMSLPLTLWWFHIATENRERERERDGEREIDGTRHTTNASFPARSTQGTSYSPLSPDRSAQNGPSLRSPCLGSRFRGRGSPRPRSFDRDHGVSYAGGRPRRRPCVDAAAHGRSQTRPARSGAVAGTGKVLRLGSCRGWSPTTSFAVIMSILIHAAAWVIAVSLPNGRGGRKGADAQGGHLGAGSAAPGRG